MSDATTIVVADEETRRRLAGKPVRTSWTHYFQLIPGFAYLLLLYIIGYWVFNDPRLPFVEFGPFKMSWIDVLSLLVPVVVVYEILRVGQPGVDNSTEVALMATVAIVQLVLVAVSFWEPRLNMFKTTESLILTFTNFVQVFGAARTNSRSLTRTIAGAPVTS